MKNVLCFLLCISLSFPALWAQVYVNANATGNNNGTSWTDAYTDLNNAISSSPVGSQIWVATATYLPGTDPNATFELNKQLELYGGFAGSEASLAERDISANPTILSGDINGDDTAGDFLNQRVDNVNTVMQITSAIDNNTIIDGFTISGGKADSISTTLLYNSGGGIYTEGAPIIRHCKFIDNFASNLGGGLLANNPNAHGIRIESCHFEQNYSDSNGGGAAFYFVQGDNSLVTDCIFNINRAISVGGGLLTWGSELTVNNSCFQQNTADFLGGGMMAYFVTNNLQVTVDSCQFEQNLSTLGGGFYGETEAVFTKFSIQNTRFSQNRVELLTPGYLPSGGGLEIYYDPAGDRDSAVIRGCLFEDNKAEYSGGGLIFVADADGTHSVVDSCSFQRNSLTINAFQGAASTFYTRSSNTFVQYSRSHFAENIDGTRGALSLVYGQDAGGEAMVQSCKFNDNKANSYGPAISVRALGNALNADIKIVDSYFESNAIFNPSFGQGGALSIASFINDFQAMVDRCEFVDNRNDNSAAAIQLFESPNAPSSNGAKAIIQNSLFTGHGNGRAVIIADEFPNTTLSNNTISDNDIVGIIAKNGGNIKLRNNILSQQDPTIDNLQYNNGSIESLGGNLISDSSGVGILGSTDIQGLDPEFEYGPEHPYKISFLSPAVDLGVFYPGFLPTDTDVAGNPRFQGGALDAGAYESPFLTSLESEANSSSLSLYPVPVVAQATIKLDNPWQGEIALTVYNAMGQKLYRTQLNKMSVQQSWEMDLSSLAAGNYQIVLTHKKGSQSKRFMKQ